ncbi:hypothetical protein [Egbenema bharatensis]|uniref:hypothetical protein n=1 Tax=Egbenema bharatensis TaxID=3463334 RepID=UPI003A86E267
MTNDLSVTSIASQSIQVGSLVRKRGKRGWKGTVLDIQEEWVSVRWVLDKHPERLQIASLELFE